MDYFSPHLRSGVPEQCKELVEAGYDVRQPDKENVTLLHEAAVNKREELVKRAGSLCDSNTSYFATVTCNDSGAFVLEDKGIHCLRRKE